MAIKREREWYWRDSLGNTEQHLQTGAEVDYLKPEDGTPLSGVTTPAGTFRCAKKKKKNNTKTEQEEHYFQPNGKKIVLPASPPLSWTNQMHTAGQDSLLTWPNVLFSVGHSS